MKVFINPGHAANGEPDPGAVHNFFNFRECDIALSIGKLVKRFLLRAGCYVELLQSHNLNGEAPEYGKSVVESANDWEADVFVSIHCNAFDTTVRGAETLVYDMTGGGKTLGDCIQKQLVETVQKIDPEFPDRGLKSRPLLCVLRSTEMPAVLVECGFIDNDYDALIMMYRQQDIAAAIARGVTDYWQKISREE